MQSSGILPGTELLHAHKEIEAGKECYTVSVNDRGRVSYYYVSPNGHILTARREPFSLSRLPDLWIAVVLVAVIAGVMPGAISRRLAQAGRDRRISIAREWVSTWLGALVRHRRIAVPTLHCSPRERLACCSSRFAFSAVPSRPRSSRLSVSPSSRFAVTALGCRRWIIVLCTAVLVLLLLSIPLEMLRIERENRHFTSIGNESTHRLTVARPT